MKRYKNKQKYCMEFYEIYAKKTLEYCYNKSWKNCFDETKECPDLQSEQLDVGVEVTSSINKNERQINSLFNKYIAGQIDYKKMKNKIVFLGGYVSKFKNSVIVSPAEGLCDFKNHIDELVDIIVYKTKIKLPHYKKFSKNILYIFTGGELFNRDDINDVCLLLRKELSNCILNFDMYFINCTDHIFIINLEQGLLDELIIEDNMLIKLKSESLKESEKLMNS